MSVSRLTDELSAAEIYEWVAYDLTNSEEFSTRMAEELEMERQANMSAEERAKLFVNMFSKPKGK